MEIDRCPSSLELDRYVLGELSQPKRDALHVHMSTCAACQARIDATHHHKDQLRSTYPSFKLLDQAFQGRREPTHVRRARVWTLGSLGLAAAASLSLWWSGARLPTHEQDERTKGGLAFSYHVKRAEHVFEGGLHEVLAPGDAIQFAVRTNHAGYLAIVSVDGRGAANVYYPLGPQSAELPAGRHALPLSTVLDEALGHENVWAVFCATPFELAPLREQVQAKGPSALLQDGCQSAQLSFEKRALGEPR